MTFWYLQPVFKKVTYWSLFMEWIIKNPIFHWYLIPFLSEAVEASQHMQVNMFLTTYWLLIKLLLEMKRRLSWLLLLIHLWLELILLGRRLKVLLLLHIIAIAILRNSIQPFGCITGRFDGFSLRFFLSTFFGCCQIFEIKIKFFGGFFLPCVIINNIFIYLTII